MPLPVEDFTILHKLGLMVLCSSILLLLSQRFKIPTIVVYILGGLLLGPMTGVISVSHDLEVIAEIGILLLLFLVGLELSFSKVKDLGATVLLAGMVQMALTAVPGYFLARVFGLDLITSVFIGLGLMFSSTVVVVKQLEQVQETDKVYGRLSIGILLVQDLMVIIVLTVVSALQGSEALDFHEVAKGLLGAALGMGLVVLVALLASRFVLPKMFDWASTNQQTAFLWSLTWCFCLVALAEALHLSPEIGAFLAGMALAQLPYAHHFRRRINPLTNFFVAIFFVTLGIKMEIGEAFSFGWLVPCLVLFVVLFKLALFVALLPQLGQSKRTAWLTGLSLMQISEFSLILSSLGVASGLIEASLVALLSLVALITMSLSSVLFTFRTGILDGLNNRGLLRPEIDRQEPAPPPPLENHIILVGINPLSLGLLEALKTTEHTIVLVERDSTKAQGLGVKVILGDAQDHETLEDANFRKAKAVITSLHIEPTNEMIAYRCREAGVPCLAHAFDRSVVPPLQSLGAHLINSRILSTRALEETLRDSQVFKP